MRATWRPRQTVLAECPCRFCVARRLSRGPPAFKLAVEVTELGSRLRGSGVFYFSCFFLFGAHFFRVILFYIKRRTREFPCCRANILEKGRGVPRKLFEVGAITSMRAANLLRQPSCFRGPILFRNVGNPEGARDSGRLSLLTFFGEAKKVSCRRLPPAWSQNYRRTNHIRRDSRCSARPTIGAQFCEEIVARKERSAFRVPRQSTNDVGIRFTSSDLPIEPYHD
jgi:hypothetical protein